jgi:hypothetical protein
MTSRSNMGLAVTVAADVSASRIADLSLDD